MLLIIGVILLCFASCQNQKDRNNSFHEFNLDKLLEDPEPMVMSDFVSEISYIPLESSEEASLSRVHVIIPADEYLIISHRSGPVKLFSINGDYIREIGRKGKGPGEYVNIGGIFWDELSEEIIIQDISLKSLLYYSLEGDYLRSFRIPYQTHFAYPLNDGSFLGVNIYPVQMDSVYGKNYIFNTAGEAKPFWSSEIELEQIVPFPAIQPTYCRVGNKDLFFPERSDSIYIINHGEIIPFASFNLKSRILPDKVYFNSNASTAEKRRFIMNFFPMEINDNEFMMFFLMNQDRYVAFCDTKTDKARLTKLDKNGFKNDIDGGLPLNPAYCTHEGFLFKAVSPIDLLSALEEGIINKPSAEFMEMVNQLNEEDNHVIIKMKLK